ncbi:FG-GAP-like repeat-containing protein [Cohnella sp. GbtcB17]|uniref:FG-GAP-like repeat-containing protein n=1 Tax=Cohnella sp. GbtcB17 TaxID=2824762 RepID=UPI001C2FED36|nr:FG-GAP-like repeat-containing protein [Cohnella sp. GbtcB17]
MKRKLAGLVPAALALALAAAPIGAFAAGPKFQSAVMYTLPAGSSINDIAFADLDGDGHLDAVASDSLNNRIAIFKGNGDGTLLATPAYQPVGVSPRKIAIAQLDGDGIPDIAVTSYGDDKVTVLLGNGGGTFKPGIAYTAGDGPTGISAADLDGDSFIDLAIVSHDDHQLAVLYGNGAGTYSAPVYYPVGTYPYDVIIRDFDKDGDPDMAVSNDNSGSISVLLNKGSRSFDRSDFGGIQTPTVLVSGDFNGDGFVDLATADNGSVGGAAVLLGLAGGAFSPAVKYPTGAHPLDIAAGDFDGDGRQDLAVMNQFPSSSISILNGIADGTFQSAIDLPIIGFLAAADLNEDGLADLAYANSVSLNLLNSLAEGELAFSSPTFTVAEDGGNATVTVNRTGSDYGQTKVRIQTSDGSAVAGTDYTAVDTTIVFGPGETSKNVTVPVTDNSVYGTDRTFGVTISGPTNGATLGGQTSAIVTIQEDEQAPDTTAPTLDPTKFAAVDNYSGTPDRLAGAAAAVGEAGAIVRAYRWNDDDTDGVIDAGELETAIALGTSAGDGSVAGADIGDLGPGTYKYVISAEDAASNESPRTAAAAVTVTLTKGIAPDVADPTWPAGAELADANVTRTGVKLSWPAAADDRGVDHYELTQDGGLISSPAAATLSYDVTGLTAGTSYAFEIVAVDAAGNRSAPLAATVTTSPLVDPAKFAAVDNYDGTPDTLAGAADAIGRAGATVRAYRWTDANSDGIVDAGELGAAIALGTSAADGSVAAADLGDLAPGAYKFVVTATDGAGTESPRTAATAVTVTLTKGLAPDVADPTWPAGAELADANVTRTGFKLSWPAADDDRGIDHYELKQDGGLIASPAAATLSYDVAGLTAGKSYAFEIVAVDAAGNRSAPLAATVTTSPLVDPAKFAAVDNYDGTPDTLAGAADAIGRAGATVRAYRWTDANSDGIVDAGELGAAIALGTSAADGSVAAADLGDLAPGVYKFVVTATDGAGTESPRTAATAVTVTLTKGLAPDVADPTWPAGAELADANVTRTGFKLSWPAADDDRGIDHYELKQDGGLIASPASGTVSYDVSGLTAGTSYAFEIVAVDAAGNRSAPLAATVTTSPLVDPAKFAAVDNYAGTPDRLAGAADAIGRAGATVRAYRWTDADSDGIVDAGELGAAIALGTSAADGSVAAADIGDLAPGAYKFVVTATDDAGTESPRTAAAVVTITLTKSIAPDIAAPAWPADAALSVSAVTYESLRLAWPAAQDDGGVDHYELKQGAGAPVILTAAALSRDIEGLAASTAYEFSIVAVDAAGNRSAPLTVTATTLPRPETAQPSEASSETRLRLLTLETDAGSVSLTPAFDMDIHAYEATTTESRITLNAEPLSPAAILRINGQSALGKLPLAIDLAPGKNVVQIEVQAANGNIRAYDLTINRRDKPPVVSCFGDIRGHWAEAEINEACALGLVKGGPDGLYRPDSPVTRAEWAVMTARWLKSDAKGIALISGYADSSSIPAWAREAIDAATDIGILNGYPDGTFRPAVTISRAEMTATLVRTANWTTDPKALTNFADDASIPFWAKPYAAAAAMHGIMNGKSGNRFEPGAPTTRAEAAALLVRLTRLLN